MNVRYAVCCRWLILLTTLVSALSTKAQVSAKFTATPDSGCAPLVVHFTDQSTGSPVFWKWDLGNGTVSFLQNPSVTYFAPGQYNIKLYVRNATGTADSLTKMQYITVFAQPTVAFTGTPLTGCFPLTVQFSDQSNAGNGTISSWEWDFGDGTLSNLQNPSHVYTAAGSYNVSLRLKNSFGCTKSLTKTNYIVLTNGVKAGFTNNVPNSCTPPVNINFQNTSTGVGVLSYIWDFGDGSTSNLTNPSHGYSNPGSYTVSLIVINATGCRDTLIKTNAIVIGSVQASFTARDSACVGTDINLSNTSTPTPASVNWSFGDGTNSTVLNPAKNYSAPGVYTIKMVANFGACVDSASRTVTIMAKPTASFSSTDTASCLIPYTSNFTSSTSSVTAYLWNFGDGTTSTLANPSHTYTGFGFYTVSLTVTNAYGCTYTVSKASYIKIIAPVVRINNLPRKGCAPFTTSFSPSVTSLYPVTGYYWDFGDGATSTLSSPSHTYTTQGSYTIKLRVVTAGGCTDSVTVNAGVIVSSKPVANFVATPRDVCAFKPVNFTDLSSGNVDQWYWQFGDGGTSSDQHPIHEYGDTGKFTVTLIVWNNGCADTIKFNNYIHISPPIARFNINMDCKKPFERAFRDTSIGANSWAWDFGDGTTSTLQHPVHTYPATGNYTVKLSVTNFTTGCSHEITKQLQVIREKANFTASDTVICKGTGITFTATGSNPANLNNYRWDFGDGLSAATSAVSINKLYTLPGKFTVSLVITDILGCKDTLVKPLYIKVDGPTAKFKAAVTGSCLNTTINFTDSSYDDGEHPITQYTWNYGDGVIETLTAGPFSHSYTSPGIYTVSLKVTDSKGCVDSLVRVSYITISKPVANFKADTASCPNRIISFTNLSTGPNLSYAWDFGDGTGSTIANPAHQYAAEGIYSISLTIVDQYGCTDVVTKNNYVNIILPRANFAMSDSFSTCPPLIVAFTNTSTGAVSRSWDFGDGTSSTLDNPSHFYSISGIFTVKLTITGPGGCTDIKTKQIEIRGPRGSFTYTNTIGCKPLATNFKASTQDNLSFIWDFNDGTLITTTDSVISHPYTNTGIYVPKMILVDAMGCQVPITGPDTIKVYGVDANFYSNAYTLCDSGFVNFRDTSISNDLITSYNWNFGDGGTSAMQHPTHSYNSSGNYVPKLKVTTQFGCVDSTLNNLPIKVVSSPKIGIGGDVGACIPATLNFVGDILRSDTSSLSWSWDLANGNFSSQQNPPAQVYPLAGSYTLKLIAVNSSGCKDSTTKTIDAFPKPAVDAGAGSLVCRGSSVTLTATGANNYTWSPATFLDCTNCASPVASPTDSITYTVTGISGQGCSATDTINLKVKQPFKMLAGKGDTLCYGRSTRISASGADNYTWYPASGLSSTSVPDPIARPLVTTNYMVIGNDKDGCFKDTGYVSVKVFPIPTVDAGKDVTINVGETVNLIPAISNDVTSVTWNPTTGVFRNTYPGISVKPTETTEYTVEVKNRGGCSSKDKVTVFLICNNANIFIPNSFSPNNDGMNDVFFPRGTGVFRIKNLRIFNRWGEVVFDRNDFSANQPRDGWDGTFKGQKVLTDVFVYTLEVVCDNNSVLTFKGNVAVLD